MGVAGTTARCGRRGDGGTSSRTRGKPASHASAIYSTRPAVDNQGVGENGTASQDQPPCAFLDEQQARLVGLQGADKLPVP